MLSSVTGFFFGSSATETESTTPVDLKTKECNEGWIIVDVNESRMEEEPVASRTRQQTQQDEIQQVANAAPRRHQHQLVAPSSGLNVALDRVKGIRQNQRRATRAFNRSHLERSNISRDFQSCGKKQRQRNKNLCKSGALNARYGQR